jgi:hypothetical protein
MWPSLRVIQRRRAMFTLMSSSTMREAVELTVATVSSWPRPRFRGRHRQEPFNPMGAECPVLEITSSTSRPIENSRQ